MATCIIMASTELKDDKKDVKQIFNLNLKQDLKDLKQEKQDLKRDMKQDLKDLKPEKNKVKEFIDTYKICLIHWCLPGCKPCEKAKVQFAQMKEEYSQIPQMVVNNFNSYLEEFELLKETPDTRISLPVTATYIQNVYTPINQIMSATPESMLERIETCKQISSNF